VRRLTLVATVLVTVALAASGCREAESPKPTGERPGASTDESAPLKKRVRKAIKRGIAYLHDHRGEDGIWDKHPGVTGIVLLAFLKNEEGYNDRQDPFVREPVKYLLSLQKPDGAIYQKELANYLTAISMQVLIETKNPAYAPAIRRARAYLVGSQLDKGEGYETSDPGYGGMGYGSTRRPDLSNTQIAAEALKAAEDAGLEPDSEAWKRMVVFMSRCQNLSETNTMEWAGDDGGAVYTPWKSQAAQVTLPDGTTGLRSYGSMTYAFLKSMIYAKISKDDQRVKAAYEWIQKNYTLAENPGMGQQGLFYYYHTMAKALQAWGEDTLVDGSGVEHDWRKELTEKLLSLQRDDGSWVNATDRWWEASPNLVTAYAVLTLEELLAE